MTKIGLVTDSTADLSPDLQQQYNVHVMPLRVSFGSQTYLEGELSPPQFFLRLETALQLPVTAPPTASQFEEFYRPLLAKYDEIISLHISGSLSETVRAAKAAADRLPGTIRVVDTKTLSLGLGLLVVAAGQGIARGLTGAELVDLVSGARARSQMYVALDTLKYLEKGGRIGRLAATVGSLLNMKPLLTVADDGAFSPAGRAFSREKATHQILKSLLEDSKGRKVGLASVVHGAAQEAGGLLADKLAREFGIKPYLGQIGAVIGTHAGPGSVGAAVIFDD